MYTKCIAIILIATLSAMAGHEKIFYLDSGSTHHMVNDCSYIENVQKLEQPIKIHTANGPIWVEYTGDAYCEPFNGVEQFKLSNVLYHSALPAHLISMGKTTQICQIIHADDKLQVCLKSDGRHLFTTQRNSANLFPVGYTVNLAECSTSAESPQYMKFMTLIASEKKIDAELLHRRLGHVGYSTLKKMNDANLFDGFGITNEDLDAYLAGSKCDACMAGKMKKLPHPASNSAPDATLHVDVSQIEYETITGKKSIAVALWEPMNYSFVAALSTKDEAGPFTKEVISLIEQQTGTRVRFVKSDNGGEYVNKHLESWFQEKGIQHDFTVPYNPQMNGKAERLIGVLQEKARSILAEAQLPTKLWAEAINTANFLRNITIRLSKGGDVPYVLFWGRAPAYANLRIFGCKAYVLIPKELRTSKMNATCEIGMLVGYGTQAKYYRILLKDASGRFYVDRKRDVVFDESQLGMEACFTRKRDRPEGPGAPPLAPPDPAVRGREAPGIVTRSGRVIQFPDTVEKYATYFDAAGDEILCLAATVNDADDESDTVELVEPLTLQEAMCTPQKEDWQKALDAEYGSIIANDTYAIVDCPPGVKPLPGKWVFKIKRNANGDIERFKCRWVVKGFKQIYGVDYLEVSAPVARLASVRCVLALACEHGWTIHHLDTDTAFLHGVLKEQIYMEQPHGYEVPGDNKCCLLKKCLYGLKQAPLVWNQTLKAEFEKHGFTVSLADASVLILVENGTKAFAVIFVDDQIMTGPDDALTVKIKSIILQTFPGKDLGEPQFFVGIKIQRDLERKLLKLSQPRHIEDLLILFGQTSAKPVSVPMDTSLDLSSNNGTPLLDDADKANYGKLVGSLIYLSMSCRPDIAYSASVLSRYLSKPTKNHWLAAIKVLRYLGSTRDYGLVFGNAVSNHGLNVIAYCDSNFAGDREDSISTYGYVFMLNGAAVTWTSKKQDKVAHSTAEAEYVAASHASREAAWFRKVKTDLDLPPGPITIMMDNQTALQQVKELIITPKMRHMGVHYHAALERARHCEVQYEFVPSTENVADIFTKPLARILFEKFRSALGIME